MLVSTLLKDLIKILTHKPPLRYELLLQNLKEHFFF